MVDRRELAEDLDAWTCPNCGTAYLLNAEQDPMLDIHHEAALWCGCDDGAQAPVWRGHVGGSSPGVRRGSGAWPSQEHRRAADHGQKPDDADDQAGYQ